MGLVAVLMLISNFVAPSEIHGLGLFARDAVPAGTRTWVFDPTFDQVIKLSELNCAPQWFREFSSRYGFYLDDYPDALLFDGDNGRFMNHSRTPNTDDHGYAVHDIAAGEELTTDYGFEPPCEPNT